MTWANRAGFFLLCTVVTLTTLAYGTVHQPIIAIFYVSVAALAILWVADCALAGELKFSRSLVQVPLLAAAIYGAIQVIPFGRVSEGIDGVPRTISLDPFATQVSATHFLALFFFLTVALTLFDSTKRLRWIGSFIIVFGFLFAFFAILQSVLSPQKIYGIYESRFAMPFGSFVNRHNFAAFIEMAIAIPLGLMFVGAVREDKRLLYLTAIGLMGISLLLSGSRGGLIAFVAELILLVILTTGNGARSRLGLKIVLSALLLAAVVGGAIFVGGDTSLTRFAETASKSDVSTGRMQIWRQTVSVIEANFPLGAGLGAFGVAYTPHDAFSGLERVEQAHNDYLQVLADAGLVGLVIGIFFLVLIFGEGIGSSRIENLDRRGLAVGAFAGIFAVLVHSIFDFVMHTTAISVLFLVLIAILVSSRASFADDAPQTAPRRTKRRSSGNVSAISRRLRT
jgi:O-antigen ligase